MYLAREPSPAGPRFFLRESYCEGDLWRSRHLADLGTDPGRFVHYPGGNAYFIDPELLELLDALSAKEANALDEDALDDIFWPFVDPRIQRAVGHFRSRAARPRSAAATHKPHGQVHMLDRRRHLFLRTGRADQRRIAALPDRFWIPLGNKARDELEQFFIAAEGALPVRERKRYLFVVFDLQRFFHQSFARTQPGLLPTEETDRRFLEAVCRLQRDPVFWAGMGTGSRLHAYLVRYVIMFFDHEFGSDTYYQDLLESFVNRRRQYRPPPSRPVDLDMAGRLFGLPTQELVRMGRRELTRRYRRLARRHHPDRGGSAETFIRLTETYRALRKRLEKERSP